MLRTRAPRGGKFRPPTNPIRAERGLPIQADDETIEEDLQEYINHHIREAQDDPVGGPAKTQAWEFARAQMLAAKRAGSAQANFLKGFQDFLLGKETSEQHKRVRWAQDSNLRFVDTNEANRQVLLNVPGVRQYLMAFVEERSEFEMYLQKMRQFGPIGPRGEPPNINTTYLYYKYVVNRQQLTDAGFLKDFSVFRSLFARPDEQNSGHFPVDQDVPRQTTDQTRGPGDFRAQQFRPRPNNAAAAARQEELDARPLPAQIRTTQQPRDVSGRFIANGVLPPNRARAADEDTGAEGTESAAGTGEGLAESMQGNGEGAMEQGTLSATPETPSSLSLPSTQPPSSVQQQEPRPLQPSPSRQQPSEVLPAAEAAPLATPSPSTAPQVVPAEPSGPVADFTEQELTDDSIEQMEVEQRPTAAETVAAEVLQMRPASPVVMERPQPPISQVDLVQERERKRVEDEPTPTPTEEMGEVPEEEPLSELTEATDVPSADERVRRLDTENKRLRERLAQRNLDVAESREEETSMGVAAAEEITRLQGRMTRLMETATSELAAMQQARERDQARLERAVEMGAERTAEAMAEGDQAAVLARTEAQEEADARVAQQQERAAAAISNVLRAMNELRDTTQARVARETELKEAAEEARKQVVTAAIEQEVQRTTAFREEEARRERAEAQVELARQVEAEARQALQTEREESSRRAADAAEQRAARMEAERERSRLQSELAEVKAATPGQQASVIRDRVEAALGTARDEFQEQLATIRAERDLAVATERTKAESAQRDRNALQQQAETARTEQAQAAKRAEERSDASERVRAILQQRVAAMESQAARLQGEAEAASARERAVRAEFEARQTQLQAEANARIEAVQRQIGTEASRLLGEEVSAASRRAGEFELAAQQQAARAGELERRLREVQSNRRSEASQRQAQATELESSRMNQNALQSEVDALRVSNTLMTQRLARSNQAAAEASARIRQAVVAAIPRDLLTDNLTSAIDDSLSLALTDIPTSTAAETTAGDVDDEPDLPDLGDEDVAAAAPAPRGSALVPSSSTGVAEEPTPGVPASFMADTPTGSEAEPTSQRQERARKRAAERASVSSPEDVVRDANRRAAAGAKDFQFSEEEAEAFDQVASRDVLEAVAPGGTIPADVDDTAAATAKARLDKLRATYEALIRNQGPIALRAGARRSRSRARGAGPQLPGLQAANPVEQVLDRLSRSSASLPTTPVSHRPEGQAASAQDASPQEGDTDDVRAARALLRRIPADFRFNGDLELLQGGRIMAAAARAIPEGDLNDSQRVRVADLLTLTRAIENARAESIAMMAGERAAKRRR